MADIIAQRAFEKLTPTGSRPGTITLYKPTVDATNGRRCRYTISGLRDDGTTIDREGRGVDSAQALLSASHMIGVEFLHEPAVCGGCTAWDPVTHPPTEDFVPLPLSRKGIAGADPPQQWLTELDDGVRALRSLRDWLDAAETAADAQARLDGLERAMRHLQIAGPLPVDDHEIARVAQLRYALRSGQPPRDLRTLVHECLLWWTRAGQS